jgi:methionine synthase II (cobalamin-independent)
LIDPPDLQEAFAQFTAGGISQDELQSAQNKSAKDTIERLEATGEIFVTDGEQRISSFATYPIIE